jgi:hypothetical protein
MMTMMISIPGMMVCAYSPRYWRGWGQEECLSPGVQDQFGQ